MLLVILGVLQHLFEVLKNDLGVLLIKKKKKPNFDQVYRQAFGMTQLNLSV